jgi:hypothetical protein
VITINLGEHAVAACSDPTGDPTDPLARPAAHARDRGMPLPVGLASVVMMARLPERADEALHQLAWDDYARSVKLWAERSGVDLDRIGDDPVAAAEADLKLDLIDVIKSGPMRDTLQKAIGTSAGCGMVFLGRPHCGVCAVAWAILFRESCLALADKVLAQAASALMLEVNAHAEIEEALKGEETQ